MGLGWLVSEVLVGLMQWPENNKAIYRIRLVMAYHAIARKAYSSRYLDRGWYLNYFPKFVETFWLYVRVKGTCQQTK